MSRRKASRIHADARNTFAFYSQVARFMPAMPRYLRSQSAAFYYSVLHFVRENRTRSSRSWQSIDRHSLEKLLENSRSRKERKNAKPYSYWLETSTRNAKLHRMQICMPKGPTIVDKRRYHCVHGNVTSLPVFRFPLLPSFLFLLLSLCLRYGIR